jgi:hypothetical protein
MDWILRFADALFKGQRHQLDVRCLASQTIGRLGRLGAGARELAGADVSSEAPDGL